MPQSNHKCTGTGCRCKSTLEAKRPNHQNTIEPCPRCGATGEPTPPSGADAGLAESGWAMSGYSKGNVK